VIQDKAQFAAPAQKMSPKINREWNQFLINYFSHKPLSHSIFQAIFEPLRQPTIDDMVVVGHPEPKSAANNIAEYVAFWKGVQVTE